VRQAKKHIHNAQLYTLYNIGVDATVTGCGSLQKKIEKKLRKYLVVPNIFVLSLSLSLSLSLVEQALPRFLIISYARAKRGVPTIANKGLTGVFFVLFCIP